MKSVFLSGGARASALRYLLQNNEDVIGVIVPHLSDKNRRFEEVVIVAVEFGIPVYPVNKDELLVLINKLRPDCLISCGFPYLVPKSVIDSVRYAVNVHPTLLPKYRGFRSGAYVLINGEKKTGVTVHFINPEMDKGDIIVQMEVSLSLFDTPKSMYRKTQEIEGQALYEALRLLESGNFNPVPQNEDEATEYKEIRTPAHSEIDPDKSLSNLYNEIRACDPDHYPAFFYLEGQKVCIKLWRMHKPDSEKDML